MAMATIIGSAVRKCQNRKGVPILAGRPFLFKIFFFRFFSSLLCVSALIFLLSCEAHRIANRRKRLFIIIVGGLTIGTSETHQSFPPQNAAALGVGILLPVVRVLERERTRLISSEVARRWSRSSCRGSRSGRPFLHHRQSQDFALDGFEFSGIPPGVLLDASELFNFFVNALDAAFWTRVVGEKLRRIFSFGLRFELFEKLRHRTRVVPRVVQNLSAHDVGLRFSRSRISQKYAARRETPYCRQERAACGVSTNCSEDAQSYLA